MTPQDWDYSQDVPTRSRLLNNASWMLFVDGENLTKRGQEVLKKAGHPPTAGPAWCRDVFLWLPHHFATNPWIVSGSLIEAKPATRAYYYTSTTSGETEWTETRLALRELGFEPRLFPRRQGKSKAVDIALATDVVALAGENRYEVAVIFAGDGDYVPVVEAVKRLGQHVVVGFFAEEGLSPELRIAADEFVDVTEQFVGYWRDWYQQQELDRPAEALAKERAEAKALATAKAEAEGEAAGG